MPTNYFFKIVGLLLVASLGSCGFVTQQLKDKADEERLLKPGALDSPIATNFDVYIFEFLDRYMVSHAWPITTSCGYGSLQASPLTKDVHYSGGDRYIGKIYERDGTLWREGGLGSTESSLNRYVRSIIRHQPIYVDDKGSPTSQPFRYEDQEQGLQAMCFQAWVGTSHTLILRLHKRNLADWKVQWSQYNPSGKWSQKQIKGISWAVLENDESELQPKGTGGWFKSYVTPIADTGYSISFQLGASQQSLQNPQAHAAMQEMFRHLIESVKIEPLTPAIEAEQAQLKARAEDIQRQECIESAKRGKPGVWCKTYGIQ